MTRRPFLLSLLAAPLALLWKRKSTFSDELWPLRGPALKADVGLDEPLWFPSKDGVYTYRGVMGGKPYRVKA